MKETAYLLQAALISVWWVGLASNLTFFAAFQFDDMSPTSFWAFFIPDIVFIAGLSVIRTYHKSSAFEYIILGAFGYASLYCVNATLLTNSGYLSTGLMLSGLAYNVLLCFNSSLFRTSSSRLFFNATKTLIQIVCIWLISLVAIPYVILEAFGSATFPRTGSGLYVAGLLFCCFSILGLTSAYYMVRYGEGTPIPVDQTNRLVLSGPYRFVRNPMAIAGLGQGLSVALLFFSLPLTTYCLLGGFVWHLVVRPLEERDMIERFGEPYLDYQKRISCWIPRFD